MLIYLLACVGSMKGLYCVVCLLVIPHLNPTRVPGSKLIELTEVIFLTCSCQPHWWIAMDFFFFSGFNLKAIFHIFPLRHRHPCLAHNNFPAPPLGCNSNCRAATPSIYNCIYHQGLGGRKTSKSLLCHSKRKWEESGIVESSHRPSPLHRL